MDGPGRAELGGKIGPRRHHWPRDGLTRQGTRDGARRIRTDAARGPADVAPGGRGIARRAGAGGFRRAGSGARGPERTWPGRGADEPGPMESVWAAWRRDGRARSRRGRRRGRMRRGWSVAARRGDMRARLDAAAGLGRRRHWRARRRMRSDGRMNGASCRGDRGPDGHRRSGRPFGGAARAAASRLAAGSA